jgi:aconitate hydratase
MDNESPQSLNLIGDEIFDIEGLGNTVEPQQEVKLVIHRSNGQTQNVPLRLRIDTPIEVDYHQHGGILSFVLRSLLAARTTQ